jgi:hypothetical protein
MEQDSVNGRVRFGTAAGNEIPADWAPKLLNRLWRRNAQAFGEELGELATEEMTGIRIKAGKPRAAASE